MTMLDDDRLTELFGRAAEAFAVPESGPAEILARAERADAGAGAGAAGDEEGDGAAQDAGEILDDGPDVPARGPRVVALARRHRILSVAACIVVVLVVAGTIGAALRSPSGPTVTSLRAPGVKSTVGGATGGVPLPTTTIPIAHASGGSGVVGAPSASGTSTGAASGASTPNESAPPLPAGAVGQPAKIEQTGTLSLTVKRGELTQTMTGLTNLASSVGGFVATSQSQNGSGAGGAYGNITLEVPVDDFATVLKAAEHYGKTTNVSTNATDVTGQYVDLQARLDALEASRQQYLTILSKATSIGDILSVQEQLDGIQQQIEQLQGQLQVLTSQTSYSKLVVTLNEHTPPPPPGPLPESGLVHAWHDSVGGFVAGVEGVVRLAGPFLFALLCLALVAVGGRVLWRRYQRHRL